MQAACYIQYTVVASKDCTEFEILLVEFHINVSVKNRDLGLNSAYYPRGSHTQQHQFESSGRVPLNNGLLQRAAMPLLQTPGPAPDFTANAFVNGAIGNVALRDYKVS